MIYLPYLQLGRLDISHLFKRQYKSLRKMVAVSRFIFIKALVLDMYVNKCKQLQTSQPVSLLPSPGSFQVKENKRNKEENKKSYCLA